MSVDTFLPPAGMASVQRPSHPSTAAHPSAAAGARTAPAFHRRQRLLAIGLILSVVLIDQATKWWGWRNVAAVRLNVGGDPIVGARIGAWYANTLGGAALDVLSFAILLRVFAALLDHDVSPAVRVPGVIAAAGWGSNLADRLGCHFVTAPGGRRGAVDFLCWDRHYYNLADVCIAAGTTLWLVSLGYRRLTTRRARLAPCASRAMRIVCAKPRLLSTRMVLAVGLAASLAVLGAVFAGGTKYPVQPLPRAASAQLP